MPNNLDRAVELVRQAIDEDFKHNYEEAHKKYLSCLDYFALALKDEKNEQCKQLIQSKISEYIARADMLKRYLAGEVDSEENALGRDGMAASRPPSNHTLDRAIEFARRAIDEDVEQNYSEAYKQYQNSVNHFLLALKYEKNDYSKRLIWTKLNEYVTRAEKLKQHFAAEGMSI